MNIEFPVKPACNCSLSQHYCPRYNLHTLRKIKYSVIQIINGRSNEPMDDCPNIENNTDGKHTIVVTAQSDGGNSEYTINMCNSRNFEQSTVTHDKLYIDARNQNVSPLTLNEDFIYT